MFPIRHLVGTKSTGAEETQVRASSYANDPLILEFARKHQSRTRERHVVGVGPCSAGPGEMLET